MLVEHALERSQERYVPYNVICGIISKGVIIDDPLVFRSKVKLVIGIYEKKYFTISFVEKRKRIVLTVRPSKRDKINIYKNNIKRNNENKR